MKQKRSEDGFQKAVCQLLDIYVAQRKLRYFAVPNGGKRSKIEAAIMKGLGVKAGVQDLVILISRGPTLFIELKAPDGRETDSQAGWREWINDNGGNRFACVCWSLDQIERVLKWAFGEMNDALSDLPRRYEGLGFSRDGRWP